MVEYSAHGERVPLRPSSSRSTETLPFDPRPFDRSLMAEQVSRPVDLGPVDQRLLEREWVRCLNLPIKLPGSDDYYLPSEWKQLLPLLERIVDAEHAANPLVESFYCYLTVDCGRFERGEFQREPGCHLDGYQGALIEPKTLVARNYLACTNGATVFYDQTFAIDMIDDSVYDVFALLDQQKRPEAARQIAEERLYAFDVYAVHEAAPLARDGLRTFVRITYELERYDRKGFSLNPLLPVSWSMVERDYRSTLLPPPRTSATAVSRK